MEFTRGQDSKRSLGIGVFKDMVKPDSLILPVIYQWGEITDKHGQPIIKAHRESGKTPLAPYERDQILKDVAELLNMAYGAKTVAESLDFVRGQDSKKSLRVGAKYAPGAEKDFEDVEPGDLALDYNEMPHRVVAKIKGKYNSYGPEDLDQTADPIHQFVQRYDGTGAAAEMFYYPDESPVEEGEDLELIAVEDDHGIYVFTYGGDGAYAVWE